MFTNSEKKFGVIFIVLVLLELICVSFPSLKSYHFFTKPSILIALIFFYFKESKTENTIVRGLVLSALILSLLGDVLLMFVTLSSNFFILGLVAFLLAHIFYVLVFLRDKKPVKKAILLLVFLLLYGGFVFKLIKDGVGALLIPVIVYMGVILLMVFSAFLRRKNVTKLSYTLVLIGAVFFVVSDSFLALNKFYTPLPLSGIAIMFTYATAQFLIVFGLKNKTR